MEKIRNMLGGGNKAEEGTYDPDSYSQTATHHSTTGKPTGEGSHLSSVTGNTDTSSSGTAPTSSGPHSSDFANKVDPRVDPNSNQSNTTGSDAANQVAANQAASAAWSSQGQSSEIPSHHRKESIPTTAYPSGTLDSPKAVAPPVGAPASGNSTATADESSLGDDTGRATVGETSTYRSQYLGSGDPMSSTANPNSSDPTTYRKPETSHLGQDVGVGAGAGEAGTGAASAYDGSQEQPDVQSSHDAVPEGRQPETASSGLGATGPTAADTTSASQGYGTTSGSQPTSQPFDQTGDRHLGRDAAVASAGVGAAGIGAHEHSKHEAEKAEKEQKAHDEAPGKEERHHQKTLEKEERHREREVGKEEAAAAGAVGAGAVGAHEHDQHHDNTGAEQGRERKPSLIQRILHPRSSKASTQDETSGLGAADVADRRAFHEHGDASSKHSSNVTPTGYAEAPTKGYASQVTGGTGTTALAQGESGPSGSHITALGNVLDSGDPSARSGSAANYPTKEGHVAANHAEAPSSGYASQVTGGTGTTALATGGSGEPVSTSTGGENLAEHQHGIHGSGLARESMTGQPGTGHQFGEITDHPRR